MLSQLQRRPISTIDHALPEIPLFKQDDVNRMEKDLTKYCALLRSFNKSQVEPGSLNSAEIAMSDAAAFWRASWQEIPSLAIFARYCFTIVPSSAAAERVFSILKSFFSTQQLSSALDDYVQTSVMLRYNKCEQNGNLDVENILVDL